MKFFIEGERYSIEILKETFDDAKFFHQIGLDGIITAVGYYRSTEKNNLVFLLPKVFMAYNDMTIFGLTKLEISDLEIGGSLIHDSKYNWIRQLSIYFYNSLIEFRKRNYKSSVLHLIETFDLNTNIPESEFSYLDLYLSFVNFYKKNKDIILYKYIDSVSNQIRKPKWATTIRKSMPLILNRKPLYVEIQNKKKAQDKEEELIVYFLSIVNHFNEEHNLSLPINKIYSLIKGKAFESLCKNGLKELRKIKYRYFNDTFKRMYCLCEIFFSYYNSSTVKKKNDEFLSITNYNIVFEDMVDKLFTQRRYIVETNNGISIEKLKNNADGKILDHIYDYKSIFDRSDIFYIGDSKYYKPGHLAGSLSKYKQYTYAKNIIQFNVDLLNDNRSYIGIRYRDELTDGYNITPNFFIYGYINGINNYLTHDITAIGPVVCSFHYFDRLFDRDTLFIQQYRINFLFVLKAYTTINNKGIQSFCDEVKASFRNNFIEYFSDKNTCSFEFFEFNEACDKELFLKENFRSLIGKCYNTAEGKLILAKHCKDESLSDDVLTMFNKIEGITAIHQ